MRYQFIRVIETYLFDNDIPIMVGPLWFFCVTWGCFCAQIRTCVSEIGRYVAKLSVLWHFAQDFGQAISQAVSETSKDVNGHAPGELNILLLSENIRMNFTALSKNCLGYCWNNQLLVKMINI